MLSRIKTARVLCLACALTSILSLSVGSKPPAAYGEQPADQRAPRPSNALTRDFQTYIDANKILMFVTNKGSFAFDNGVMLGKADGFYYPYTGIANIENGSNTTTAIYAGSIWVGAVDSASGDTLVTSGQHDTDWGEGPLVDGAPVPGAINDPHYRVYQIYHDSLANNPNQDYLEWPVEDGAPVDGQGNPEMIGDQMLWSVYNDLDVNSHIGSRGTVGRGLGIEVQQTVWASEGSGDIVIPPGGWLDVHQVGSTDLGVGVVVVDAEALTGHDYMVVSDSLPDGGMIWRLIDVTTGQIILDNQVSLSGIVTDGFEVRTEGSSGGFESFEVVANGAGPIDPPESAAAVWAGFPVPDGPAGDGRPTDNQQVGDGMWLFHTGDNGGTSGGGTRGDFESFWDRTLQNDPLRLARLGSYDWEMRFTGTYDNPGDGGSYAWEAYDDARSYWVPFELWRIGINTPDDPSDDLRLIPHIIGTWYINGPSNDIFDLSSYGSGPDGNCGPSGCEHSVSVGDNDPFTDYVYWRLPTNETPGEAGYLEFESAMRNDPQSWPGDELPVMERTVLVNWNGGEQPPFNQDLPEQGTVFRLVTSKHVPIDTFTFTAELSAPVIVGPESVSVYAKFKMINKGGMTLNNFFASIWFDPDLGFAGDDFIGCDSTADMFYCYNANAQDTDYGTRPPAVGARLVEGPIVPSLGDTASVDGYPIPNYKNLGMGSVNMYVNPYGPDTWEHSYNFMNGLTKFGSPLLDHLGQPTKYFGYGDPVAGTGFLDSNPADRRMMANLGPFTFRPNDTQQVVIKISVGQGDNNLNSITYLKQILQYLPDVTDVDDELPSTLPSEFSVEQNYPNPFNPSTTIDYSLPSRAEVDITIYNIMGQTVTTLRRGWQSAGDHTVVWNGTDDSGTAVASGVYFYRIRAGDNVSTKKMLLLK